MNEKLLGKAAIGGNSSGIEQEDSQHGWKGGDGKSQVRKGQHGKKIIHWNMQRGLCFYEKEDSAVPQDGQDSAVPPCGKGGSRPKYEHAPCLGSQ